jgi:cobalt-zinc-cadmium efflux system membrane fusion protein
MSARRPSILKILSLVVLGVCILGLMTAAMLVDKTKIKEFINRNESSNEPEGPTTVRLAGNGTIAVDAGTVAALGIRTAPAEDPARPSPGVKLEQRRLVLSGSLGFDTNHFTGVNSIFTGQIKEIGKTSVVDPETKKKTGERPLDYGDWVEEGQLLAVLWSKDLGEKKSQLVSAVSQLRLDQERLTHLEVLLRKGAIPEQTVRDQRQKVELDIALLEQVRDTLRTWQVAEDEIEALEKEAEEIRKRGGKLVKDDPRVKRWARVEVRAPFDGVLVERNVAPGKIINDVTFDLFKITDLSKLRVWVNAFEEDLPLLQELKLPIAWSVQLKADPRVKLSGQVEKIGPLVDPNDHTVRVMGVVENSEGRMKAGQFIVAIIELPPGKNEVAVPATALVVDGKDNFIFVQSDPKKALYTLRKVAVVRRLQDWVFINDAGEGATHPGELVVTAGAVELKAQIDDLQSAKK